MIGGSLCSGSGGLDLGLERVLGIDWAWHCESDRDARAVLDARWPGVPVHGDLWDVAWDEVEPVHLVAAGFPCPDYSVAGRRAGISGVHGDVWFGVAAALRTLRPPLVVLENVDGIRTASGLDGDAGESALGVVLADLAALGYDTAWSGLRAADVGAPHGRLRWFLVGALAPDPLGAGIDADGRVRPGDPGDDRPGRSAPSALAPEPEVDVALQDGGRAAADADGTGLEGAESAGRRDVPTGRGGPSADAGRVAREATGERDGGPGAGGEPRARRGAGEAERRAAGRDRGRGEAAPDADRRGLGDAEAAATDAAGGGRDRREAGEGVDATGRETAERAEGDADAGDGGRASGGADGDTLLGVVTPGGGADAAPDTGSERAEPRGGRRASGGKAAADAAGEGRGELVGAAVPVLRGAGGQSDAARGGEEGDGGAAAHVEWGVYGDAVRRWERTLSRPAPAPTDDRGRLHPEFVTWMLGYPEGWVDVAGVSRTAQLRLLGNSVQVQCAERVGAWLVFLLESGLLPDPWAEPVAAA